MRKLRIALILIIAMIGSNLHAQEGQSDEHEKSDFKDKVFIGGGFGAGFGDYTYVSVSPIIGYRFTNRLSGGMRFMYQYTTFDYIIGGVKEKYQGNDFGISPFAQFLVYGPVFLQAEYEFLSYDALYYDGTTTRTNFDSFLAGGGINQPMGRKASFFLMVLYNFSYQNYNSTDVYRSPYNSPWVFRIGVAGGF